MKEDFYDSNPKPNAEFDEYGLRYDIEYLNNIGVDIVFAPIEYMVNYVDVVTMKRPAAKQAGKIVGTDSSAVPELVRLLREEAKVI